jgi:hypothetical protein
MRSDVIGDFQDPYGAVFGLVGMAVQCARLRPPSCQRVPIVCNLPKRAVRGGQVAQRAG